MCGYKLERTGAVRKDYLDDKGMQMTECCEERTSKESDIIIMMGDEEKIVEIKERNHLRATRLRSRPSSSTSMASVGVMF